MAMVMMTAPSMPDKSDVAQIETAYHTLTPLLGGAQTGERLRALARVSETKSESSTPNSRWLPRLESSTEY